MKHIMSDTYYLFKVSLMIVRAISIAVMVGVLFVAPVHAEEEADARQPYRFVLKADGRGKIAFRGLITVDGKDRLIDREETPFEFQCESGSMIAGYFEVLDPGHFLRLLVFDPDYFKRRAALKATRFDRIRFSWAQPGVGPRCVDPGEGACPDTTPSVNELKKRLESLLDRLPKSR